MNTNRLSNSSTVNRLAPPTAAAALRLFGAESNADGPALLGDRSGAGRKLKTIIVFLDGSVLAEHAIPVALGIAEQSGAVLQLIHVIVPAEALDPFDALCFPDATLKAFKRRKHHYLAEKVDQIAETSSAFVSPRIVNARTVPHALDEIGDLESDLVVMATHGRGAFGRLWSGSIGHDLLQCMSVPLIMVRGNKEKAIIAPKTIDNVLLPWDGSKESEKALELIKGLGIFPSARHTLVHVIRKERKHLVSEYALRTVWVPSRRHWIAGMQHLHPLATTLREHGRNVHTKIISSDEPVGHVVLRYAKKYNADLIALTYRRRGSLTRLLRPSTSEHLFRASSIPLMFVPMESQP